MFTDSLQNNGEIANVKIEYTTDGGSTWNVISNSTTNEDLIFGPYLQS